SVTLPSACRLNTLTCGPPPVPGAVIDLGRAVAVQVRCRDPHPHRGPRIVGKEAGEDLLGATAEDLHMGTAPRADARDDVGHAVPVHVPAGHVEAGGHAGGVG